MTQHPATCKFCQRHLVLEIDDSYAEFGDKYKLFHFACCDKCADLRERRRNLEEAIARVMRPLAVAKGKLPERVTDHARALLVVLTKKYTRLVADWLDATAPWWDEEIVKTMMECPNKWTDCMKHCWKLYEPAKEQSMPYTDQ